MREVRRWRGLLALTGLWTVLVAAFYVPLIGRLSRGKLEQLWDQATEFFLWQALGFVLFAALVSLARPRWLGRASAAYLGLSTLALLALSRNPTLFLAFFAFALWWAFATAGVRRALHRLMGREHATWGLSAAGLYGALIPAAFVLGVVRGLNAWVVALVALAAALPGALHAVRSRRSWARSLGRNVDRLGAVGVTSLEAIWILLAVALVWAVTPEMFSDSIRSYLPDVQDIARQHGLVAQYLDLTRVIPRAFQSLCALGFVLGGYPIAKCLSWVVAAILAAVVWDEVARRSETIDLGLLGGAVILACPLLMGLSTSLMFDHAITLFTVASFVALGRGLHFASRRGVAFSGFLMACAIQIKYNALIFCVIWVVCLAIVALHRRRPLDAVRFVWPAIVTLTVFGCPWYLYMWATTGSPVFPYLNDIFGSPYAGGTTLKGLDKFRLGETPWSRILFPWTVTFHTSRIVQRPDGALGFMALALLPLVLALRGQAWRRGRDLAVAGAACVAGICLVTVYARYWLPGYPLLLMPLVLGLGKAVAGSRWTLPRIASPLLVTSLLGLLLLQLPIWNAGLHRFPWQVYTGEVAARAWLAGRFSGFSAVEELNRVVEPHQRVLATNYPAVYTIAADAYEFPAWHAGLHGLEDAADLRRLLDRHAVGYWLVDYSSIDALMLNQWLAAESELWTDSRLMAAESHVAVYDVSASPSEPPAFHRLARREIPPLLLPPSGPRRQVVDAAGWHDVLGRRAERASSVEQGRIRIAERGAVEYVFSLPPEVVLCRATFTLRSESRLRATRFHLEWLDGDRQVVARTSGGLRRARRRQWTHFFGRVPEGAHYGRLRIQRLDRRSMSIGEARIDFLGSP